MRFLPFTLVQVARLKSALSGEQVRQLSTFVEKRTVPFPRRREVGRRPDSADFSRATCILAIATLFCACPLSARADDAPSIPVPGAVSPATSIAMNENHPAWARFASGKGTLAFVAAGTLFPLAQDGSERGQHTLRAADSLLTSTLITEALKRVVREKRPDSDARNSFPSGHATAAFALATMEAHFHPNQALLWYAGATVIAASRVKLRRHRIRDVVAGAAVGVLTSRAEINQSHGLLLFPFIHDAPNNRVAGLSFGGAF